MHAAIYQGLEPGSRLRLRLTQVGHCAAVGVGRRVLFLSSPRVSLCTPLPVAVIWAQHSTAVLFTGVGAVASRRKKACHKGVVDRVVLKLKMDAPR